MADQTATPRPAAWRKDPTGRHFGRFWDGTQWTEHVISAEKVQSVDPLPPRPEPSIFEEGPPPPPRQAPQRSADSAPTIRGPVPTAPGWVPPDPKAKGQNQVVAAVRGWPRWAKWTLGVVAALVIVGAAAGGGTDDEKTTVSAGGGQVTTEATTDSAPAPTKPATTRAPATTAAPTPTTVAGPKTTFGNGQYRVGTDIAPGTYVAPGGTTCYWERQATFGGSTLGDIIANDLSRGGQVVVTIAASDKGFKTSGCGTWVPG